MDYATNDRQIFERLNKTDYKNLSKNDVLDIASKPGELRPDVAKEVLAQFPELVKLIQSALEEYKGVFSDILSSDDESLDRVYSIVEEEMDSSADSRKQFYEFLEKVYSDLSKCLDNPNLTAEGRNDILIHELEILKLIADKDSEIRAYEKELCEMADRKDSEKRHFDRNVIIEARKVFAFAICISVVAVGAVIKQRISE